MTRTLATVAALVTGIGHALAQSASAQPTTECTNLANPASSGIWTISSERSLPTRFQFQQFKGNGENFAGVSGSSPSDIWAVGGDGQFDLNGPGTDFGNGIVYHFDGAMWCRFNDPELQNPNLIVNLDGVAALAPDNAWAVGTFNDGELFSLIQHWDGSAWRTVPSPNPGDRGTVAGILTGISAVSPDDIWAVGWYEDKAANSHALLAHFDGHAWTAAAPPASGRPIEIVIRVFARAAGDVWAVGVQNDLGALGHTLIEHFDGTRWSIVPSANAPKGASGLVGVTAIARNDAWAVGSTVPFPKGLDASPLIEHWDGAHWSLVRAAPTGATSAALVGIAGRAADDVWAVGSTSTGAALGNGNVSSLVQHWNGRTWSVVASPNANAPGSSRGPIKFPTTTVGSGLNDVAILSAGALVAVGQYNTLVQVPSFPAGARIAKPHPWSIMTTLP
jgi:hypothetical protein